MTLTAQPGSHESQRDTDQLAHVREAARHLTNVTSVLPTLYFAIISFSDIRQVVQGPWVLFFLAPALPWIAAVLLAAEIPLPVDLPRRPIETRADAIRRLGNNYYRRLRWAYRLLVIGLVLVMAVLACYLLLPPPPP